MKHQKRKNSKFGLLFIFAAAVSLAIGLIPFPAEARAYKDLNIEQQARSYAYYRAMVTCVSDGIKNEITASADYDGLRTDPANGYWYGTGDSKNPDRKGEWWSGDATNTAFVSPYSGNKTGERGCSAITKTALADYWGEATPADLLVALNYEWNGTDKWVHQGGDKEAQLKAFLTKQGVSMEYTAPVEYFLNYNAFVNKCNAKELGLFSELSDSNKKRIEQYGTPSTAYNSETVYTKLKIVTSTGTDDYGYTYEFDPETGSTMRAFELYEENYKTCEEMANNISSHATAYSDALMRYACAEEKGLAGPFVTACIAGIKNSADPNYCTATYADQSLRDACLQGQSVSLTPPSATASGGSEDEEGEGTTCAIGGIGWIICPVVTFLAEFGDSAYGILSDNFLRTGVDIVEASDSNGAYIAWGVMRSLANVVFVIVFLVIIFSQLTGAGVSNYGVKKMLPRLVIGAILVNVSFIICQIAVDISNILGYSIRDFFDGIAAQINEQYQSGDPVRSALDGGSLLDVFGGILAGGAAIAGGYFLLGTGGTLLIAGLLALGITLLILIARQVIIVLGIVIAPLAFVAWILPNTEKLFKQWVSIFSRMLLVFPIVSLIFGASIVASVILGRVAWDEGNLLGQIIAALIPAVALFAVIPVIQGAIKSVPAIGQMASRFAGRANANLGKRLGESYKSSTVGRGRAIRQQARDQYRARKFAEGITGDGKLSRIRRAAAGGVAVTGAGKFAQQSLERGALSIAQDAEAKDIQAMQATFKRLKIDRDEARILAAGGKVKGLDGSKDFTAKAAAVQQVVASNDIKGMNDLWTASKSWTGPEGDKLREVYAHSLESSSYRPTYYGQGAIAALRQNSHQDATTTIIDAIKGNAYSPAKLAAADKDELNAVAEIAHNTTDPSFLAAHQKLVNDAHTALTDPELARTIGKNLENVQNIRNNSPPAAPLT